MVHKEVSGMKFQANIVGKRKLFYIVSVVLILAGMVSMLFQGLNLGIDFTSGNKMIVQFEQDVNIAELRNTLAENGLTGSKIQELDNGSYVLKTSELTQDMEEALKWLNLSAEQGYDFAIEQLEQIEKDSAAE